MLLMFDRWRKLLKSFYNSKTDKFDISKIPDIYDSVKYDAIHNRELGLEYEELFEVAHELAVVLIPSE
jgi:inositol hexakisphosphate/diphosphoinositol-pentakisphosphate kinase